MKWGADALAPTSSKTIGFETVFKRKSIFAKSQGIYLESERFGVENGSNWEKGKNFTFVQIWNNFQCGMKSIFGVFNEYDIEPFSNKKVSDYLVRTLSQFALKLKNAQKISSIFSKKSKYG